jgi:hypothetical protein
MKQFMLSCPSIQISVNVVIIVRLYKKTDLWLSIVVLENMILLLFVFNCPAIAISLKMSKGYSKVVNRLRTGNTMATKGQKDEQWFPKHYTLPRTQLKPRMDAGAAMYVFHS